MLNLEIVTHCYANPSVWIYHKLLSYQLASLLLKPPKIKVQITVCCTNNDPATEMVLDFFARRFDELDRKSELRRLMLRPTNLFRRAIGRNRAALKSEAEVIWFTDADHVFEEGCLDAAYAKAMEAYGPLINMVFPRALNINKTHELGDAALKRFDQFGPGVITIRPEDFVERRNKRAWGGLQIVKGDWCRVHGYLDKTKWQHPVDLEKGFCQCKCDVPFRKAVGESKAITVPNLYRIRHSRAGRDGGKKDHGSA